MHSADYSITLEFFVHDLVRRCSAIVACCVFVAVPAASEARDIPGRTGIQYVLTQDNAGHQVAAKHYEAASVAFEEQRAMITTDERFAQFTPSSNPIQHRIDYSIWTAALSSLVISMGPPLRKKPWERQNPGLTFQTRIRVGHNSLYRLDGSMMAFSVMDDKVRESFTEYRRDLESVADTLDIQSIPRNEQLAFWFNLHNVAMVEQIAKAWPVRQPHEIEIDGVPLHDAKFITIEGIALSLSDIREKIVYANWRNPKVIYGFWHGEIGGPALQREAYAGPDISDQLDRAAREFANSRRGTEKRGDTLHVSRLYEDAAPYFFKDFNRDVRAHLAGYVEGKVAEMLDETTSIKATLREKDIADLAGGSRSGAIYAQGQLLPGAVSLIGERARKFDYMRREGLLTGQITFSNIDLPGDPEEKNEVE